MRRTIHRAAGFRYHRALLLFTSSVALAGAVALVYCAGPPLDPNWGKKRTIDSPLAVVKVSCPRLAALTLEDRRKFELWLRRSPNWEVRDEISFGRPIRFAVNLEPDAAWKGKFEEGNGFLTNFEATDLVSTRVLVGLGRSYGFGNLHEQVTKAAPQAGSVRLRLTEEGGQPGTESYLLVEGGAQVTFEVFEQGRSEKREFTQKALDRLCASLEEAMAGKAPAAASEGPRTPSMTVSEGFQPGMYRVTAWVNPGEDGTVVTRVFYVGPSEAGRWKVPSEIRDRPGAELSKERIESVATRAIGFSDDAERLFPYRTELTVYEGGWDDLFQARFELWFTSATGQKRKLIETTQTISGWER